MSPKAVVLLSGGLDSTVNLYAAHNKWDGQVLALSFDYGQKAFKKEVEAANFFCEDLKISHRIMNVKDIFFWDQSSLTSQSQEVPTDKVDIQSMEASQESAKAVWVANRNGVFLNIAACVAESLKASFVVPGFNKEEAETFPDNSVEYIDKINETFKFSTSNQVRIECFTQEMNKKEIFKQALDFEIPIKSLWPCYYAGAKLCGRCESCQRFNRAKEGLL